MPATTTVFLLSSQVDHFDRPTLRLTVEPAYFNEDGELRFYNSTGSVMDNDADNLLADLRISALYDIGTTFSNAPYGWRVEFRNVYAVTLTRAEAMVKTLRKIERGLAKLDAKWGTPQTFGTYVIRVGIVLKVARYGHRQTPRAREMTGQMYRWGDPDTLLWQINQRIHDFDNQYGPKNEVTS